MRPARPQYLAAACSSLAALRSWAPTLADAVAAENRFRLESGLPLLPERPPEEIGAALQELLRAARSQAEKIGATVNEVLTTPQK